MEITLQAALVAVVAIVPGAIADTVFRRLIGADWRQSEWSRAIRLVGFSAVGLALYAALSGVFGLPAPSFIFPSVLATAAKDPRGRAARAGEATLRRGIFLQSLVSSESGQRLAILK